MVRPKVCRPLTNVESVLPMLSKISILGGLNDQQISTVLRKLQSVSYHGGELIFEAGDQPNLIYIIRTGLVKLVARIDDTPLELVEYGEGQCFGETSAIGILPHSATALAVTDVELLVLSGQAIHEFYREDPSLFGMLILNIAREVCRRLHKTDDIMLHYATRKR